MSAVPPKRERSQVAQPDEDGNPTFEWTLTPSSIIDKVRLKAGPFDVLPVIFVPGIMGSNLKSIAKAGEKSMPVWRLDDGWFDVPWSLVKGFANKGPGPRQHLLHPDRSEVDDGGGLPGGLRDWEEEKYKSQGWGEIGRGTYHEFLVWLENELNPLERNPALLRTYYQAQATVSAPPKPGDKPSLFPGIRMGLNGEPFGAEKTPFESILTDDLIARSKFLMPIYACGYNWLASNRDAARRLQQKIRKIIGKYNGRQYRCEQVILVTHSMGGLVARACAELDGMADKIAGIVHGVMPATGAAVAYRRCKIGMRDEDPMASLVIGGTGQSVTAVFAQAPGALQLLPSHAYASNWMTIFNDTGEVLLSLPGASADPYATIYREHTQWWGLVNEAWLSPKEGAAIDWAEFETNVDKAEDFHKKVAGKYHASTYTFYGADEKQESFENVSWRLLPGVLAPEKPAIPARRVVELEHTDIRGEGRTPAFVGNRTQVVSVPGHAIAYKTGDWVLHCETQDAIGDGTVPTRSGAAPLVDGGAAIKQQFKLPGFGHEKAYLNPTAQRATLYAIDKIAGKAKRPA